MWHCKHLTTRIRRKLPTIRANFRSCPARGQTSTSTSTRTDLGRLTAPKGMTWPPLEVRLDPSGSVGKGSHSINNGVCCGGWLPDHWNTKFQEHPELQISANLMMKLIRNGLLDTYPNRFFIWHLENLSSETVAKWVPTFVGNYIVVNIPEVVNQHMMVRFPYCWHLWCILRIAMLSSLKLVNGWTYGCNLRYVAVLLGGYTRNQFYLTPLFQLPKILEDTSASNHSLFWFGIWDDFG